jgi:uncharacterized membrane protein
MASEKFRRQLRQEVEDWWSEGLIDAALYERLADRYQFRRLEQDASNRFIAILLGLGAILLGLGAITFVAANWQLLSRTAKVVILLACFVGVNAVGFYLWRRPLQTGWQRLGQGLLLLGALLLGANMALMSQLFHQSGEGYELFLIWGLGVALMAYSLRLVPLGILALILVIIGYCLGWTAWIGWDRDSWQEFSGTRLLVQHLPLLLSLVFVPLAYWCRSRVVMGLSAAAVAISLVFNLRPLSIWNGAPLTAGWIGAIAFVLPPALLWSYRDHLWQYRPVSTVPASQSPSPLSQPLLQTLALWFLAILFYVFAFRGFWTGIGRDSTSLARWDWSPLIDAVILGGVALLGWLEIGNPFRWRQFQAQHISNGSIAIGLIVAAAFFLLGQQAGVIAVLAFNLLLFLLAMGLIRDGLALGHRATFWGGMVLLVLGIISRMLEYDTGLLLKALVFVLCGIGIILAGLRFERSLRSRPLPSLPPSSSEEIS